MSWAGRSRRQRAHCVPHHSSAAPAAAAAWPAPTHPRRRCRPWRAPARGAPTPRRGAARACGSGPPGAMGSRPSPSHPRATIHPHPSVRAHPDRAAPSLRTPEPATAGSRAARPRYHPTARSSVCSTTHDHQWRSRSPRPWHLRATPCRWCWRSAPAARNPAGCRARTMAAVPAIASLLPPSTPTARCARRRVDPPPHRDGHPAPPCRLRRS